VIGNPPWTKERRFSDSYFRWQNQDELDRLLEAWTINYTSYELMHLLQDVGVAAVPSFTSADLFSDPHLGEREFCQVFTRSRTGSYLLVNPPWKLSLSPASIVRDAPDLGEHNEYVFGKLLGMSEMEIQELEQEGILY
jgi:crotonobetainyl-CoA:carnitine CoA-transferase CaiB-like acyl-CoA transferase